MKKTLVVLLFFGIAELSFAQDYKFGRISEEEVAETIYQEDSTANAAVLYKKRNSYYSYNGSGVVLTTDYHLRIKIYTKEGIDWATHTQYLANTTASRESFSGLKGVTYNLVNGEVEETKLDKKEVFKESITDRITSVKFTMPNVSDGSVVEFKYRVTSPFYWMVDDIVAQYEIPIKKLDISVALWEYFKFSTMPKGYLPLNIQRSKKHNKTFETSDVLITINQNNIPAIIEEAYVNNIENYMAGLAFEIRQFVIPGSVFENFTTSWDDVAKNIYESDSFGGELGRLRFLKEEIAELQAAAKTDSEKIVAAMQYVKSKIIWNGTNSKYSFEGIKNAVKEGSGNSADINLLLTGVLRELGLTANPVLVSTRSNGIVLFPSNDGFNYVTAAVELENGVLILDATEKYGVPGVLPMRVLNGQGRLVRENRSSRWVTLTNSQPSKITSNMNITIKGDGTVEGMSRTQHVNSAALYYRDKNVNVNEDDFITSIEAKNGDIMIGNFTIQNKAKLFKPVIEMFTFEAEDLVEQVGNQMMFKPLFFKAITENPFKLDERQYPVDFGTPFEIKNTVRISVPEGYEIVSVPEQLAIGLPEDLGVYKFVVNQQGNTISIMTLHKVNTGIYPATHYTYLKEFYNAIVNKSLESVVIKKSDLLK